MEKDTGSRGTDSTDAGDAGDASTGPTPPPPRVAVIDVSSPQHCVDRFTRVLANLAEPIVVVPLDVEPSVLAGYDLVILCEGWAYLREVRAEVLGRSALFTAYVEGGGGLLVYQPGDQDEIVLDLLPAHFSVNASYHYRDDAVIVDSRHPAVIGLQDRDVPYPADILVASDHLWRILARGSVSGDASLLVLQHQMGRAALDLDSPLDDARAATDLPHQSDRFLAQLSAWLMRRR